MEFRRIDCVVEFKEKRGSWSPITSWATPDAAEAAMCFYRNCFWLD